jgi:hypothetical protein
MPMNTEFNRGAIQPMDCYRRVWELVKPQYGLMLGICLVGMLIASVGPLGLLLGPMMCGIFLCYFKLMRGEPIEFNTLFTGFDYLMPGWVVALIQVIPLMLIQIPYAIWIMYLTFGQMMEDQIVRGRMRVNPMMTPAFLVSVAVDTVVLMVVSGVLQMFLVFGYALIVDRQLGGLDAAKLSARAAVGNLGGVLGIMVINLLLGIAGLALCYVGAILIIPITMGVWAVAYRQVFPEQPAEAA